MAAIALTSYCGPCCARGLWRLMKPGPGSHASRQSLAKWRKLWYNQVGQPWLILTKCRASN